MSACILVVEDEPAIRDAVAYALAADGYVVSTAADGSEAFEMFDQAGPDLVILDLMLPGLPGTEVCRRLRRDSAVPIVMLTAKDAELDKVLGLEIGADDYVTKPFSMAELLGRVRALLRRRELDRAEPGAARRKAGRLELDLARHVLQIDDRDVRVTPSEFKLLELMTRQPERVFTRAEIMRHLWESEYAGDRRACDTHVANVRAKIESDPSRPERLVTVRGVGYKLMPV